MLIYLFLQGDDVDMILERMEQIVTSLTNSYLEELEQIEVCFSLVVYIVGFWICTLVLCSVIKYLLSTTSDIEAME